MENERHFDCTSCMVSSKIVVEPGLNADEVKENAPDSIDWLTRVEDCPVCGSPLEE